MRALCAMGLVLASCGQPVTGISPTLLDESGINGIQSMDVFVVEAKSSTGAAIDCANLMATPLSSRADLIVVYHHFLPFTNAKLESIPSSANLIIAIDAYSSADGTGSRIANACTAGISIAVGQATSATLTLHAAQ